MTKYKLNCSTNVLILRSPENISMVTSRSSSIYTYRSNDPPTGTMLLTPFQFAAIQWQDDDLPMTYEYSYSTNYENYLAICSRSELSFCSSLLPAGLDIFGNAVDIKVVVYDRLNAASESSSVALVSFLARMYKQNSFFSRSFISL